jgi:hypothetical protein
MKEDENDAASHFYTCEGCGKVLDKRDLGQVLSHGWINKKTGKIDCTNAELQITYTSVKKVGDKVRWITQNKRHRH